MRLNIKDKIGRNEKCPCGSELKYKKCCLPKTDEEFFEGRRHLHELKKVYTLAKYENCLYRESELCDGKIIGAHSIQNNGVISKLAEDGHVLMPSNSINDFHGEVPKTTLVKKGRNQATVFSGFCKKHDNEIFKDIDNCIYKKTEKQNFLFAYRSFAKQYFEQVDTLNFHRLLFRKYPTYLASKGYVTRTIRPSYISYLDNEKDKKKFDEAFENKNFSAIFTVSFTLSYEVNFSVSSCFEMSHDLDGNRIYDPYDYSDKIKPAKLFLNILPQNGETNIIFSCFKDEEKIYKSSFDFLTKVYNENLNKFKTIIVNIIGKYCDNVVFGNKLINYLGEDAIKDYLSYYEFTAFKSMIPELNNLIGSCDLLWDNDFDIFKEL